MIRNTNQQRTDQAEEQPRDRASSSSSSSDDPRRPVINPRLVARDIMTPEPVCVPPSMDLRQLARLLAEEEISGAPVVGNDGRVIGVVSITDFVRLAAMGILNISPAYLFSVVAEQSDGNFEAFDFEPDQEFDVSDIMTESAVTVGLDTSVAEIARQMHEGRVHRVVVVNERGFPEGIITSMDVLGAIAEYVTTT